MGEWIEDKDKEDIPRSFPLTIRGEKDGETETMIVRPTRRRLDSWLTPLIGINYQESLPLRKTLRSVQRIHRYRCHEQRRLDNWMGTADRGGNIWYRTPIPLDIREGQEIGAIKGERRSTEPTPYIQVEDLWLVDMGADLDRGHRETPEAAAGQEDGIEEVTRACSPQTQDYDY